MGKEEEDDRGVMYFRKYVKECIKIIEGIYEILKWF